MALHGNESKSHRYVTDAGSESKLQTLDLRMSRSRQTQRQTKTDEQLIKDLVGASSLIANHSKQARSRCLSLDLENNPPPDMTSDLVERGYGPSTSIDGYHGWMDWIGTSGYLQDRANVLLYPDLDQHCLETTTQATYRGVQGVRPPLAKPYEGTLKVQGDMDLDTTNRLAFTKYDVIPNPVMLKGKRSPRKEDASLALTSMSAKGQFFGETQAMRDFPGFKNGQPSPPSPVPPAPNNLAVPYHVKRSFETEQRRQFAGIDPLQHPRPKPFKIQDDSIQQSTEPFEKLTSHKLDYHPFNHVEPLQRFTRTLPRVRHSIEVPDRSRPFEGQTTNDNFFKEWPISLRHRYGDPHDAYTCVPPIGHGRMNPVEDRQVTLRGGRGSGGHAEVETTRRWQFQGSREVERLSESQARLLVKELRRRRSSKREGTVRLHQGISTH